MVTRKKVIDAYDEARAFYDSGYKSNNKAYNEAFTLDGRRDQLVAATANSPRPLSADEATARVAARHKNQGLSIPKAREINTDRQSPLQIGAAYVRAANTAGNCGEMACVMMYFAEKHGISSDEMWLATATNSNTTHWSRGKMVFGHSWAQLGSESKGLGLIMYADPWAGVCCLKSDYPRELKLQLDKWQRQGKRVCMHWERFDPVWTNANDDAILSLVATNASIVLRGANVVGRSART